MQFFPHVETASFPSPSPAAGFLADRQPDEGFAALLSSQMDRNGVGSENSAVQPGPHPESAAPRADVKAGSDHDACDAAFQGETREKDVSGEAPEPERLAGERGGLPEKSAIREKTEQSGKKKDVQGDIADKVAPSSLEGFRRELMDAVRALETLLEPVRGVSLDDSGVREENARAALHSLQRLLESMRKEAAASGADTARSVCSGASQAKIKPAFCAEREDSGVMPRNALGQDIAGMLPGVGALADTLMTLGSGREILSAQDRGALREALARLRDMHERMAPLHGGDAAVRPASAEKRGLADGVMVRGKAERISPLAVYKEDVSAGPEQHSDIMQQTQASAEASPAPVRTVQDKTAGVSVGTRDAAAGKQAAQDEHSGGKTVLAEPSSASGQDRAEGNFFRERGAQRSSVPEKESAGPVEGTGVAAPRKSVDAGPHQILKTPDSGEIFMPQTETSARPAAAFPEARTRGAEVLRQVETGAFRDLEQGGKQLVIRLDPPDLGQVSVILQVRGKDVQAVLRTSNQETSQILNDQLGQLRTQLESQGLKVARLEVQTQLADSQTGSQWHGAEQHNRYQENRELAMTARRLRSLGRVDAALARDMQNSPHKENISLTGVDVFA